MQCPNIIGVCSANTSAKALRGALRTGAFTHIVARAALVQTLLSDLGAQVTAVDSGYAALEVVQRERFDLAVSRAVAPLNVLCELSLPLVRVGGSFLAMKSVDCAEELQSAKSAISQLGGQLEGCEDYTIPGTDVTHRVVRIRKVRPTPKTFPRAFAKIKKNPLR